MNKFKEFLNSLSTAEQAKFAKDCGTTIQTLRVGISKNSKFGAARCMAIEMNSNRRVTRLDLLSRSECKEIWPVEFDFNTDFKIK